MNKFLTKIAGAIACFAMAIGVGVGVASKQAQGAYATETASMAASTNSSDATVNDKQAIKCGTGSAKGKMTITLATAGATSLDVYVAGWNNDTGRIVNVAVTSGVTISPTSFEVSNESGISGSSTSFTVSDESIHLKHFTLSNAVANTVITFEAKNSSKNRYVVWEPTYEINAGGGDTPTVDSVSVTGNMNKKTYNSVERWDKTGLTATVTMSDSSEYDDEPEWSFDPVTPGEAIKDNSGNAVSNGTITVTATASGESGNLDVENINVNYATVAQATAATPETGTLEKVVVKGIVSEIEELSTQHGNATYYISDDGTTANQYYVFRGKDLNNASFDNANDLKVGDIVAVYGDIFTYEDQNTHETTKEFKQGNYLVSFERPASPEPSITITENNFTINVGDADVTLHETHENLPDGGLIKWYSGTPAAATIGETTGLLHAVAAGSTVITVKIFDGEEVVASDTITVTVTNITYPIDDGDTFIVKYVGDTQTYYFSGITNDIGDYTTTKGDAAILTAEAGESQHQFYLKLDDVYLSYSGSANKIYTSATKTNNELWNTMRNGSYTTISSVAVSGRNFRFNSNSGQERFCCYTSASNIDVELVEAPQVNSVSATLEDKTYYEGNKLLAEDFTLTVTWTEGKADTHPTSDFTWTVNGIEDGDLTSGSNTIVVTYGGVQSDPFQVSATAQTPNMYLGNAESFATISGDEISPARTVVFSELGLEDTTQYLDPFDIGEIATVTFAGGGNDGKYYNTGTGIRTYGGGTITVTSKDSNNINKITFTWDGTNKPNSNVADVGTYNTSDCTWTGDAHSVTLTRPSGSGHWRLQSVRVVCGEDTITITNLKLRLGVSIPVADWNAINANENWEITDYGVMVFRTDAEHVESAPTPKSLYDLNHAYVAWMHKGTGVAPTARDDKYTFSGRIDYTDGDNSNYAKYMCAQAYIVVNGTDFYPVGQFMKKSIKTLAANVSSDCTNLSSSALAILAA